MNNKQLLQQYVDTGVQLPEYQVRSLPPDFLKTYLRKRIIATENSSTGLADYEFELITPDQRFQYWMKRVEAGVELPEYQIRSLPPDLLETYLRKRLIATKDRFKKLSDYELELLTPNQRFQYWMQKSGIIPISNKEFELLTQNDRFKYAVKRAEKWDYISNKQFELLTQDQRFQYG